MITFQREYWDSFVIDVQPLLPLHFKELALDQDEVPLAPDYSIYKQMEVLGILHIWTARNDQLLIGYIIGFIKPHLHYSTTLCFIDDIYYLNQGYRNMGTGFRFFQEHEKELKKLGVVKSAMGTKDHQSHQAMFSALGYTISDIIMTKML